METGEARDRHKPTEREEHGKGRTRNFREALNELKVQDPEEEGFYRFRATPFCGIGHPFDP